MGKLKGQGPVGPPPREMPAPLDVLYADLQKDRTVHEAYFEAVAQAIASDSTMRRVNGEEAAHRDPAYLGRPVEERMGTLARRVLRILAAVDTPSEVFEDLLQTSESGRAAAARCLALLDMATDEQLATMAGTLGSVGLEAITPYQAAEAGVTAAARRFFRTSTAYEQRRMAAGFAGLGASGLGVALWIDKDGKQHFRSFHAEDVPQLTG
jgi:hypothetical protein